MIQNSNLVSILKKLDLPHNCDVLIHGNSAISIQGKNVDKESAMTNLVDEFCMYFQQYGTLVIPTFSYSFTQNESFDKDSTPSAIGKFSETFRVDHRFERTNEPIFSFSVYGVNSKIYLDADNSDCFGDNSVFGKILESNGYLLFLGCDINAATFVHFVEQKIGVPYRFFKFFEGILMKPRPVNHVIRYYVRDLSLKTSTNLTKLFQEGMLNKKFKIAKFGRLPIIAVRVQDFFEMAEVLLRNNPYSLIEEGQD